MEFRKLVLIVLLYFVYCFTVQAGVITLGDLSRDTSTNIVKQGNETEWLMWTETNSFTDQELQTLFSSGVIKGWSLATYADVLGLYSSAGFDIYDTSGGINLTFGNVNYSGDDVLPGQSDTASSVHFNAEFFNLFGDTFYEVSAHTVDGHSYSSAFFWGENSELGNTSIHNYYNTHHERVYFNSSYTFKNSSEFISLSWANEGSPYSLALHRAVSVPEPMTIYLFLIPLLALYRHSCSKG